MNGSMLGILIFVGLGLVVTTFPFFLSFFARPDSPIALYLRRHPRAIHIAPCVVMSGSLVAQVLGGVAPPFGVPAVGIVVFGAGALLALGSAILAPQPLDAGLRKSPE